MILGDIITLTRACKFPQIIYFIREVLSVFYFLKQNSNKASYYLIAKSIIATIVLILASLIFSVTIANADTTATTPKWKIDAIVQSTAIPDKTGLFKIPFFWSIKPVDSSIQLTENPYDRFEILISKNIDVSNPILKNDNIAGLSYTFSNVTLEPDTYYVQINAYKANVILASSKIQSFSVSWLAVPATTIKIQIEIQSPGRDSPQKPTFAWAIMGPYDRFMLIVSKNIDLSDPVINLDKLTMQVFTSGTPLEPGEIYYFQVTAYKNNQVVTSSKITSFTIAPLPTPRTTTQATLSTTLASTNLTSSISTPMVTPSSSSSTTQQTTISSNSSTNINESPTGGFLSCSSKKSSSPSSTIGDGLLWAGLGTIFGSGYLVTKFRKKK
jgi:hypothetical protein